MTEKLIYWLEELGVEDNDLVGKKCANLGELTKAGVRVPPGFALAVQAYERFLATTGAREEMQRFLETFKADPNDPKDLAKFEKASEVLREIVDSKEMPSDMADIISAHYDKLCQRTGISDVPVAVRSAGPVSRPGQYETYLWVIGQKDLMKKIIRVWSSTFNHRSMVYRAQNGLPMEFDPIGCAVIQMVDAKVSGVMFTLHPANGDVSKIVIEANWGLGESVVSGRLSPDFYVVDKQTLNIVEKRVSDKTYEYLLDPATGATDFFEVPQERRNIPCLTDEELVELAKLGLFVEKHYGKPQDTEWTISKDLPFPQNIFMVQSRPVTAKMSKKKTATDTILDMMMSRLYQL
ncbi:MAG: phenylphosphate synthase subunit beta [Clostridia bacterium]|nr:MAG: phenylphosphate synthase subunit beta [Clostridia bacterium]